MLSDGKTTRESLSTLAVVLVSLVSLAIGVSRKLNSDHTANEVQCTATSRQEKCYIAIATIETLNTFERIKPSWLVVFRCLRVSRYAFVRPFVCLSPNIVLFSLPPDGRRVEGCFFFSNVRTSLETRHVRRHIERRCCMHTGCASTVLAKAIVDEVAFLWQSSCSWVSCCTTKALTNI